MASTDSQATTREAGHEEVGIRRVNEFFVRLVKRYLPDPYILAIILTAITFVMALTLTDRPLTSLFGDWYKGIFDLFVFILQALLVAVTGFAFAQAPGVNRLLDRVASIPKTWSPQHTEALWFGPAACPQRSRLLSRHPTAR